jgi:hypothetical protein
MFWNFFESEIRRTRKKSVNPAQREDEGGPARYAGLNLLQMAGEGKPFPAEQKGAQRLFTRLSNKGEEHGD